MLKPTTPVDSQHRLLGVVEKAPSANGSTSMTRASGSDAHPFADAVASYAPATPMVSVLWLLTAHVASPLLEATASRFKTSPSQTSSVPETGSPFWAKLTSGVAWNNTSTIREDVQPASVATTSWGPSSVVMALSPSSPSHVTVAPGAASAMSSASDPSQTTRLASTSRANSGPGSSSTKMEPVAGQPSASAPYKAYSPPEVTVISVSLVSSQTALVAGAEARPVKTSSSPWQISQGPEGVALRASTWVA